MTEFIDPCPELPLTVDIGGELYYLGSEKPVELAYKSRKQFQDDFGKDPKIECLLRRYLYFSIRRSFRFQSDTDKNLLIHILKKRAQQLKESQQFSSSILKNTVFQRTYLNIQKLLEDIQAPEQKGIFNDVSISLPKFSLPCSKAKQYIKEIPNHDRFKLALELSWYLLHPDKIPNDIECDWAKLIKELDTMRLGGLNSIAHKIDEIGIPQNYLTTSQKALNELDNAKQLAKKIQGGAANESMKNRIKLLLNVLEARRFLNGDIPDTNQLDIINTVNVTHNNKSKNENKSLDKPINLAMMPLFNYFKIVYDPVFSLLEPVFQINGLHNIQSVILPQMMTLLHICNYINFNRSEQYGIYRVTNIAEELLELMNRILNFTGIYINKLNDDKKSHIFTQQLIKLPKVRLTSLLHKYETLYKKVDSMPYIQFFIVNNNLKIKEEINVNEKLYLESSSFFTPDNIYIGVSKQNDIFENIPLHVYDIDFQSVNYNTMNIKIDNLSDNYFNLHNQQLQLEEVADIQPYITFNDAELALSILIAMKEIMPK